MSTPIHKAVTCHAIPALTRGGRCRGTHAASWPPCPERTCPPEQTTFAEPDSAMRFHPCRQQAICSPVPLSLLQGLGPGPLLLSPPKPSHPLHKLLPLPGVICPLSPLWAAATRGQSSLSQPQGAGSLQHRPPGGHYGGQIALGQWGEAQHRVTLAVSAALPGPHQPRRECIRAGTCTHVAWGRGICQPEDCGSFPFTPRFIALPQAPPTLSLQARSQAPGTRATKPFLP